MWSNCLLKSRSGLPVERSLFRCSSFGSWGKPQRSKLRSTCGSGHGGDGAFPAKPFAIDQNDHEAGAHAGRFWLRKGSGPAGGVRFPAIMASSPALRRSASCLARRGHRPPDRCRACQVTRLWLEPPPLRVAQGRDGEGSGLYRASHRSKSTPPRPSPSPAAKGRGQSTCSVPSSWKESCSVRAQSLDTVRRAESGPEMACGGESARDGRPSRGVAPGRVEAGRRSGISSLAPRETPKRKKPPGHPQRLPCLRKTRPRRPRGLTWPWPRRPRW